MTQLLVWFLYINLTALGFSLMGWLGEWVLLAHRRRVRWLWAGVMFASVVFPLAQILWGEQLISLAALSAVDDAVAEILLTVSGNEVTYTADGGYRLQAGFDRWIQAFWGATTGGTLLWLAWSSRRLRAARSDWLQRESGGRSYYVTRSIGPGVMGVIRQRVLLPQWFLGLGDDEQELIWRHEREHVRASDNRLLAAAFALLVAFTWVLPLWWQFRRLRVAVELDCDRRVVGRSGQWREYGHLLVRVAEGSTLLPVAPFAGRSPPLRRRIRCLLPGRPSHRTLRSAGAAVAMCLLAVGWLALPVPAEGNTWRLNANIPFTALRETLDPPQVAYDQHAELLNREEFLRTVERLYPERLRARGIEDTVGVFFHVSREGAVEHVRLDRPSAHRALNQAALQAARVCRFRPALREGSPVGVWLFLDVGFQTSD